MATSEVAQEIADLTPEPVEQPEKPRRLQKRFAKLTRTIHEQREEIERLQADFSKAQELLGKYRLALREARRTNGNNRS